MKQNKIKNLLLTIFALLLGVPAFAQVGIGTDNPQGVLDVKDSLRGIVLPKVEKVDSVKAPDGGEAVLGTLVYDMSNHCTRVKTNTGWTTCLLDSSGRDSITYGYLGLGANFRVFKAAVSNNWAALIGYGDRAVYFSGTNSNGVSGLGRASGAVRSYTMVMSQPMADIDAGTDHVIAADERGRVWTWGSNANFRTGQTGPNSSGATVYISGSYTALPDSCDFFGPNGIAFPDGAPQNPKLLAKQVAATSNASFVITDNGDLYSIGASPANGRGAASTATSGWGKVTIDKININDKDVNGKDIIVKRISASLNGTVGVVTTNGDAYVWGTGSGNGLGQGTSNLTFPTRLSINEPVYQIAMGYQCGAAITKDRKKLYVWGANNTVTSPAAPAPIEISSRIPNFDASKGDSIIAVGVARGYGGNLVVVTNLNKRVAGVAGVYVFGRNNYGQLGYGNTTNQYITGNTGGATPPNPGGVNLRPVSTMRIDDGAQFTGVASGGYNTILITDENKTNQSLNNVAYGAGRSSTTSNKVLGAITTNTLFFTPLTK